MRLNSRWKMMRLPKLLRTCLIIILISSLVGADTSTVERIRKHQEWLKQRNQQKSNRLAVALNFPKSNYEKTNLWRYPKQSAANEQEPSINEVYPENEAIEKAEKQQQQTTTPTMPTTTAIKMLEAPTTETAMSTNDKQTVLLATPPSIATTTMPTIAEHKLQTTTMLMNLTQNFETTTASATFSNATARHIEGVPEAPIVSSTQVITESSKTNSTRKPKTTVKTKLPLNSTLSENTTPASTTKRPHAGSHDRPYPRWGNWGKWSECSRSCGGGVSFQQRKCVNRNSSTGKRYISNACVGVYRRYHICNEQPCPAALADFRAVQCAAFNKVDFQGQKYVWEPYLKDDAECELNCKPKGMKYFATLNSSVIDGTPCFRPAEYYRSNYRDRAMCVDGVCKEIHE